MELSPVRQVDNKEYISDGEIDKSLKIHVLLPSWLFVSVGTVTSSQTDRQDDRSQGEGEGRDEEDWWPGKGDSGHILSPGLRRRRRLPSREGSLCDIPGHRLLSSSLVLWCVTAECCRYFVRSSCGRQRQVPRDDAQCQPRGAQ